MKFSSLSRTVEVCGEQFYSAYRRQKKGISRKTRNFFFRFHPAITFNWATLCLTNYKMIPLRKRCSLDKANEIH